MTPIGRAAEYANNVENLLVIKAVRSGDGFRQWLYLGGNYRINPAAEIETLDLYAAGYDWRSAADKIYSAHA